MTADSMTNHFHRSLILIWLLQLSCNNSSQSSGSSQSDKSVIKQTIDGFAEIDSSSVDSIEQLSDTQKFAELLGEPSTIWESTTIPVCWENIEAAIPEEREWVRNAINATWAAHSDLSFPGWGQCPSLDEFPEKRVNYTGVRIKIEDIASGPHVKRLGNNLMNLASGISLNFAFKTYALPCGAPTTRKECIELAAIHEFGHVLGFYHEQDRLADLDREDRRPFCLRDTSHLNYIQSRDTALAVGLYDLRSVMNYCNPGYLSPGVLTLSETDIRGVQLFYSSRNYVSLIFDQKTNGEDYPRSVGPDSEQVLTVSVDTKGANEPADVYLAVVDDTGKFSVVYVDKNKKIRIDSDGPVVPLVKSWSPTKIDKFELLSLKFDNHPFFKANRKYTWYLILTRAAPHKNSSPLNIDNWLFHDTTPPVHISTSLPSSKGPIR